MINKLLSDESAEDIRIIQKQLIIPEWIVSNAKELDLREKTIKEELKMSVFHGLAREIGDLQEGVIGIKTNIEYSKRTNEAGQEVRTLRLSYYKKDLV